MSGMLGSKYSTTYDELAPFFGKESDLARLFVTLNYKGSRYGEPINTKENPETIKAEPLWQLMLAKNYDDASGNPVTTDDNVISLHFKNFVIRVGRFHKELDTFKSPTYSKLQTASNDVAQLYEQWDNLTQDAREFYIANTNFVTLNGSPKGVVYEPKSGLDLSSLRLNLKKVDGVKGNETIFGNSLPYLPPGCTIVDGTGKVLTVDYFHQLYQHNLGRGDNPQSGGALPGLDAWVDKSKLNLDRFLRNCLFTHEQVKRGVIKVKGELDGVYDVAAEIYSRDSSGALVRDGKLLANRDNATSDMLTKGVPGAIYTCILKGDPQELARCLGAVRTVDIYDAARKEVNEMHPATLQKLLETFEFRNNRNGEPEEYLQWRASLASRLGSKMGQQKGTQTAEAILGNKKLVEYLKSVLTLYRNNPALHHQAEPLSDLPNKTSKLGSSKGLNYFVKPTNVNRAEALSRHLGVIVQNLNVVPQGLSSFNLGLGLPNMAFGSVPVVGVRGMYGGSNDPIDTTVNEMRNLYNQVLDIMKSQGKDLVEADKKRIESALNTIQTNNRQVVDALKDLKAFTQLDNALTNGLSTVELSDANGSRRIPKLRATISNLENCVNRTSRDQVSLLSALVEQVYRPMLLVASGMHTPSIRAI